MDRPHRDIIVVGASAGGVEALTSLVAGLPFDLAAAVFVVLHLPATANSLLPSILDRSSALPATNAVDGDVIEQGRIYVAPPDHHVLLRPGRIHLSRGPKENRNRPAVDPLFRSAARAYGERVIGVILSGALDDGAAGLSVIKGRGGLTVVQDPGDAAFSSMPESARQATAVDVCAPASELGRILGQLSGEVIDLEGVEAMAEEQPSTGEIKELKEWEEDPASRPPSAFTCPECHGTLFEHPEGRLMRYRCRVGHGFSVASLLAGQSDALEAALWAALRSLEERTDMTRRLAERAQQQGQSRTAARFGDQVRSGEENAELLRQVLLSGETLQETGS